VEEQLKRKLKQQQCEPTPRKVEVENVDMKPTITPPQNSGLESRKTS
jgi:hypothetical protein